MEDDLIERVRARARAWSVVELAQLLGVSKQSIYREIQTGALPSFKIGQAIRVDPALAAHWLKQHSSS